MINIKYKTDYYKQLKAAGNKVVVLEFYASWCSRCQDINKTVKSLARKYKNLIVLRIDMDKFEYIDDKYNVESMPDLVFIHNRKQLAQLPCPDVDTLKAMMHICISLIQYIREATLDVVVS